MNWKGVEDTRPAVPCEPCMPVDDNQQNAENSDDQAGCAKTDGEMAREHTGEYGVVNMRAPSVPYTPSKQERMEHDLTHVPYRSWCPHCVRGKAIALGHYVKKNEDESDKKITLVALDYAFLQKTDADEEQSNEITTMVVKDAKSKCVFPIPVPQKGIDKN